ncbi:hypothetical protein EE612_002732 [Oryza sativa]|nr:hypothetical protein EE612_002732 [Oryza sativa]
MIYTAIDTFYLTDEQLRDSPSRKDGIDEATETALPRLRLRPHPGERHPPQATTSSDGHSTSIVSSLFTARNHLFGLALRELLQAVFGWQGSWRRVQGDQSI